MLALNVKNCQDEFKSFAVKPLQNHAKTGHQNAKKKHQSTAFSEKRCLHLGHEVQRGHAEEVKLGDWRMCHCGAPVIPTYPNPIPKRHPSSGHGELTTPGCLVHSWMISEGSRLSFAHVLAVS